MSDVSDSTPTTTARRRVLVGFVLILGALLGQCAGGRIIDNPSPLTLLTFVLSLVAAIMAFNAKARRTVVGLAGAALLLTALTVFSGQTHWTLGGIWLFDVVSLIAILVGVMVAGTSDASDWVPATRAPLPVAASTPSRSWPMKVRLILLGLVFLLLSLIVWFSIRST